MTDVRNAWISPLYATNKSTMLFAEQLVVNAMAYKLEFGIRLQNRAKPTYPV